MGYHLGKTMVQEASEMGHNNPAYLLNSSQPQRPAIIGQLSKSVSYGGRPLGPHSYDVPNMPWMDEPERLTASFASKTVAGKMPPPITAEVDFLNKPELIDFQRQVAPGFHSYTWGKMAQRPNEVSAKLDKFYDYDNKLVRCRSAPARAPAGCGSSQSRHGTRRCPVSVACARRSAVCTMQLHAPQAPHALCSAPS